MKISIKKIAVCIFTFVVIIGTCIIPRLTTFAENDKNIRVYLEENGQQVGEAKILDKISRAIESCDGKHHTVIELTGASYDEMIEIDKPYITLRSADSNKPATIKGKEIKQGNDSTMISIKAHDVVVDSVNVTGLWIAEGGGTTPIGISIEADNVTINNCKVYDMGCIYNAKKNTSKTKLNAHGIIAFSGKCNSDDDAIKNPRITNCELYGLKLGNSEALVMNGNVTGFHIEGNKVHDCDNIGIDIIGYENNIDSDYDRARDGVVKNNIVYNISSGSNYTYRDSTKENPGACAGGIYVDGGKNVIIDGNYVENCDIGIELASEHDNRATELITVKNNILVNNNELGGISIGGSGDENGYTKQCKITNNIIYNSKVACIRIQHANDKTNVISKNVFIPDGDETETYYYDVGYKNASSNTIEDNYTTKLNSKHNDKQFEITSKVTFDKGKGTINFGYEGVDLSKYLPSEKTDTNPVEPISTPVLSKGDRFNANDGATYEITNITENDGVVTGGNVKYISPKNKKVKSIKICNSVRYENVDFKVTSIAKGAASKCKKLKKLTIGENVKTIGDKAFYGCKNLKKITIKSKKITKVGKKAFKKIAKSAKFIMPKSKKSKYSKMFKK